MYFCRTDYEIFPEQLFRVLVDPLDTTQMSRRDVKYITCVTAKADNSRISVRTRRCSNRECSFAIIGIW